MISSVLNVCTTSDSAASIVCDENQSSTMDVRSLFFITRMRLGALSAEVLVMARDARIRYSDCRWGYDDISFRKHNSFMKLRSTHSLLRLLTCSVCFTGNVLSVFAQMSHFNHSRLLVEEITATEQVADLWCIHYCCCRDSSVAMPLSEANDCCTEQLVPFRHRCGLLCWCICYCCCWHWRKT